FAMLIHGIATQVEFAVLGNAAYFAGFGFRAVASIVLAAICFLACAFLLFVLVQWMRDRNRKKTTRPPLITKSGRPARQKTCTSLVPGRRSEKVIASRCGRTGRRPPQGFRMVASLSAENANGWCTRGSPDRSSSAREARREPCACSNARDLYR